MPYQAIPPPKGWKHFIGQFCDYDALHRATGEGRRQLRQYLVNRFGLEVLSNDDLQSFVNEDDAVRLAKDLRPFKDRQGQEVLALNDARMILGVYGMRQQRKEAFKGSAYGFATWWLTQESLVQLATAELVRAKGAKYILRPDFVLNFICLSPTTEEVRRSYEEIMPSLLGVQLSNRMREDVFHDVMRRLDEASQIDDARAKVAMSDLSNRLKGDFFKRYEVDWVAQAS